MPSSPTAFSAALAAVIAGASVGLSGCGRSQAQNASAPAATAAVPPVPATASLPPPPSDPCPSIGMLAEAKGPISLTRARTVRLEPVCAANDMTADLRAHGRDTRYILVADDLRAGVQPGALFELRFGPPTKGEAAVIGTVNFFAARQPEARGQPHSISFDVTGPVQSLAIAGWPAQGLGVAIAPSGPVAPGADATIGALRLVAQARR